MIGAKPSLITSADEKTHNYNRVDDSPQIHLCVKDLEVT